MNAEKSRLDDVYKTAIEKVIAPIQAVQDKYKDCVGLYTKANSQLKAKIDVIEDGLKLAKENSVKEYFEENNTAYIVMEYLDGTTLRNKVKQQTFTFEETKKIMEPICHALTKIHQFGVVHLDVSPDNIMMLNDGSAKLLDFG